MRILSEPDEPLADFIARVRNMVRVPQRERAPDEPARLPRRVKDWTCLWCRDPLPQQEVRTSQYCGPRCRVSALRDKHATHRKQMRFTLLQGGKRP